MIDDRFQHSVLFHRPDFHEPVVDGVRAIAILWVLILHVVFFHYGAFPERVREIFNGPLTQWIGQGSLGVDLFFVISGYLIGTISLKELSKTDRIHMRRFYARRFLRLIPVYTVVMCLGVVCLRNIPESAILMDIAPSGNLEYAWTNILYVNMLMLWLFPKTTPMMVKSFNLGPNTVLLINGLGVTLLTLFGAVVLYVIVERPCMEYRKAPWFRRLFG